MVTKREEILTKAIECVTKDRNSSYGEPEDNFQHTANLLNAYFKTRPQVFSAFDVAMIMILLKMARTTTSPEKDDNLIDICGYAACAAGVDRTTARTEMRQ